MSPAQAPVSPEEGKRRADAAFAAMKKLGIERSRVKPVLLRLLQASGFQWEYVENENYLVLADAIFEAQDTAQEGCSRKNEDRSVVENGHREKRLKSCEESESSSARNNNNNNNNNIIINGPSCQDSPSENRAPAQKRPAEQINTPSPVNKPVLSIPSSSARPPVQHKPASSRERDGEASNKALVQVRNEGGINNKIVPHKNEEMALACRSKREDSRIGMTNSPNSSERKRIGMSNLTNSSERRKEQEIIESTPLAVVYPDPNNQQNASRRRADKGKAKVTDIAEPSDQSTNLEITSNETKDVNISFICNDSILTDPNFRPPSMEEICRQVEAKCMSSYKILNPSFSLLNILNEMCKTYKEIGYTTLEKRNNKIIKIVPAPGAEHLFQGHGIPQGITGLGYSSSNPNFNNLSLVPFNTPIPPHDHEDISRGLENIKIPIQMDPNSKEEYPPEFRYISSNISYQNAYVSISLARIGDDSCCSDCHGDCLQSPFPCACAAETGGCFAYTREGLLRKEFLEGCMEKWREPKKSDFFFCKEKCPLERASENGKRSECKGHLVRKFIKECWAKCGCKLQCGNRVVQRGITCNLQVFKASEEKGWGIRTLSPLPKGSFVCEYVGVVLTNIELYERQTRTGGSSSERHTYPVLLDADWSTEGILKDEEALCLDATHYGNVARFINHRCHDGNLIGIPVEIETPDHHYYHVFIYGI
ncbi:hypothetical protein LUZ60_016296 [Juncus effusus]|nr:hypothetical protein LUZ60_016296 [Juncus effusus]